MTKRAQAIAGQIDYLLLGVVTTLIAIGLIMVYSSSYAFALADYENPTFYLARQAQWTVLGIAAMVICALINYQTWQKFAIPIMAITLLALFAVLLLGAERFGAQRHLTASGSIQPSEPAKIAVIIYISAWLASKGKRLREVNYGLVPFAVLIGLVAGLIVAQPNFSTALLIVLTAVAMFFVAGADLRQLAVTGVVASLTFALLITQSAYANERVTAFLRAAENPFSDGPFQLRQGLAALARGGLLGQGIAESQLNNPRSIPLSWSDSIFAILGEEMGLMGTVLVVALFGLLAYRGFRISINAEDRFGMLLACGITAWLVFQAIINIAVITATAPFTGVPLPFISFGGSALITSLAGIGILLSISRGKGTGVNLAYARFDFGRRHGGARVSRTRRGRSPQKQNSRTAAPRTHPARGRRNQ